MKTKKFALQLTAAVAASAMILTGCASGSDTASSSVSANNGESGNATLQDASINAKSRDEIADGGKFVSTLGEMSEQALALHADSTQYSSMLWEWYNPQTVLYTNEGEASPNPDYITKWNAELKDGKTVVTYDLNDKAVFNDGTPFDWKVFETTWKLMNGKDDRYLPKTTDGYDQIVSVTPGTSDRQVVITFESAYPWWEGLFNEVAHPALADPANYNSYVKQLHPEWGAGPYTVESADFAKGEVVFKRNDKWWGDQGKLDQRIFRQMDSKAAINAFKNGEIDAVGANTRESYAAVKDIEGTDIRMATRPRTNIVMFNSEAEPLNDLQVRKALVLGYNRELTSQILTNGIPYTETPPGSIVVFPWQEGYSDNLSKVASYDPEQAKQVLEDAGWVEGADGIREKDGKKLSVRYALFGNSETFKSQATAIQKFYKDIGVDLQIDSRPGSDFSKSLNNGDFEMLPMGFNAATPFGVADFGQVYLSNSQLNKSHTGTPELDAQIRELQKLPTAEEQTKRANELEVEAFSQFGIFPTFNGPGVYAVKSGLANFGASAFGVLPVQNIGWEK